MKYTALEIEEACNLLCACASAGFREFGVSNCGGDFSERVRELAFQSLNWIYSNNYMADTVERALEAEAALRGGWRPNSRSIGMGRRPR